MLEIFEIMNKFCLNDVSFSKLNVFQLAQIRSGKLQYISQLVPK